MNLKMFKELDVWNQDVLENLKLFRSWSHNTFISFEKNFELSLTETYDSDLTDIDHQEFKDDWTYVPLLDILDLYREMSWEIEDKYISMKPKTDLYNVTYYDSTIFDIYPKIFEIADDKEFFYALLFLTNKALKSSSFYFHFIKHIYKGIEKFNLIDIRKVLSIKDIKTVFIAMSFDDNMKPTRDIIKAIIESKGYLSIFIDEKQHNNQIVPEIFKEIQDSTFVIADLTGQRSGVYFEAGYALACKKELILLCSSSESDKVHFDVAQINTIFWKDKEDLEKRLIQRIESTVENEYK